MEAAFYALWLIDPEDGRQRRIRGLRLAVQDNRQRGNWLDELVKIPDLSEEERSRMRAPVSRATATYHREADAIGIPWTTATQRIDLTRELGQLQHVRQSEPTIRHSVVAAWRQLSGFQHGHAYAAMAGSDHKVDATITGGVLAVLTVNDQQFGLAMQIAALLQLWAIDTYIGRTTRP